MKTNTNSEQSFMQDIKSLIKSGVLIANVVPVIAGFWLALHFTDSAFNDYWLQFLIVTIGSTLVMAGALIINNWYDADIDAVMDRTLERPTVTGHFSLKTVLRLGITATIIGFIFYYLLIGKLYYMPLSAGLRMLCLIRCGPRESIR